jgi:hypothetical protein
VSAEAGFIAGYASLLLLAAVALRRLGRAAAAPVWGSRIMAGYRRQARGGAGHLDGGPGDGDSDWPHAEARRLHTAIGAVGAVGALLLPAAEVVRHHRPAEVALLGAVAAAALMVLARLAGGLRARPAGGLPDARGDAHAGR